MQKSKQSKSDPAQLRNLLHEDETRLASQATVLDYPLEKLIPRLDALLFVLESWKGAAYSKP